VTQGSSRVGLNQKTLESSFEGSFEELLASSEVTHEKVLEALQNQVRDLFDFSINGFEVRHHLVEGIKR
jgi:hypothetical protein